jgi:hypothetical protein
VASEGDLPDSHLLAVYQGLMAKWVASRALLWQFPALTVAAQAFLIGAVTQFKDGPVLITVLLTAGIVAIAVASLLIQYKAAVEQHLDLVMLDKLEGLVLHARPDLRLHHRMHLDRRGREIVQGLDDGERRDYLGPFSSRGAWPLTALRNNLVWASVQTLFAIIGILIAVSV